MQFNCPMEVMLRDNHSMPKCKDWLIKGACRRLRLSGDMQTIRYKIDKQQGLIVQCKELYLLSYDKS